MDENEEKNLPDRKPVLICMAITGILAAVTLGLSIYVAASTPEGQQIPIYANHKIQRMEGKNILFIYAFFNLFVFFALANLGLRWKKFIVKIKDRQAFYESRNSPIAIIDPQVLATVVAIGFCASSGLIFYYALSNALAFLGRPLLMAAENIPNLTFICFFIGLIGFAGVTSWINR